MKKGLYFALCVPGLLLPYSQFVPWIAENGLNLRLLVQQLFVNRISSFFAPDVLVSSLVLVAFVNVEGRRLGIRHRWVAPIALFTVGVSLALPLFPYFRELRLQEGWSAASAMSR